MACGMVAHMLVAEWGGGGGVGKATRLKAGATGLVYHTERLRTREARARWPAAAAPQRAGRRP